MKQRNWAFVVLCILGASLFVMTRTVWGPPGKAAAATIPQTSIDPCGNQEMSDAEKRYLNNGPRHWRYVMIKQ